MANMFLSPEWFIGTAILLEIIFTIITFGVSIYAFYIYRLTNQRPAKFFAIAFLGFSASYAIQSVLNALLFFRPKEQLYEAISYATLVTFNSISIYTHMLFFLAGLITLAYVTFKISNKKLYTLLMATGLLPLLFIKDSSSLFYVLSSIFLIYISIHYFTNYIKHKQVKTLLVLIAFVFLLIGRIHFIFSVNHALFYAVGHFLELASYLLILISFLMVFKR
jgi:hypothetical protein